MVLSNVSREGRLESQAGEVMVRYRTGPLPWILRRKRFPDAFDSSITGLDDPCERFEIVRIVFLYIYEDIEEWGTMRNWFMVLSCEKRMY